MLRLTPTTARSVNGASTDAAGAQRGGPTKAIGGTGRWYEWDVSNYVRQRRQAGATSVSFVLKGAAASDPWVIFNSGEALGDRPALVAGPSQ